MASLFVLIGHASNLLLNQPIPYDPFLYLFNIPIHTFGVLIFFSMSGFLVTKSWDTSKSFIDFCSARLLRIFPALICLIFLTVVILGVSITILPIQQYIFSPETIRYLINISLYRQQDNLPGVFDFTPLGGNHVNGSLWTLPYEFTCYLVIAGIGMLPSTMKKHSTIFLSISLMLLYFSTIPHDELLLTIPILLLNAYKFHHLLLYFLIGSIFYHLRNYIPLTKYGLLLCLTSIFLIKIKLSSSIQIQALIYPITINYFIFSLAFAKKIPLDWYDKLGDLSYGIYLYAFPIQQTIITKWPSPLNLPKMIV